MIHRHECLLQYDIKSVNIQVNKSVTVWIPGSLFHQTEKYRIPHRLPYMQSAIGHIVATSRPTVWLLETYILFLPENSFRDISGYGKQNKKIHDEQKRKNRPVPSIRWYRNGIISPEFIEGIFRAAQNSGTLVFSGASLCFGQTETACSHYRKQWEVHPAGLISTFIL